MKTVLAILLSVVTITHAFVNAPVGKAVPRLSENNVAFQPPAKEASSARDKDAVVLSNALREFANWNDVWDDGMGYGMDLIGRDIVVVDMGEEAASHFVVTSPPAMCPLLLSYLAVMFGAMIGPCP